MQSTFVDQIGGSAVADLFAAAAVMSGALVVADRSGVVIVAVGDKLAALATAEVPGCAHVMPMR